MLAGISDLGRTGILCVAQARTLGIARDANDVVLTWTRLDPNTAYEVYRSAAPFLSPLPTDLVKTVSPPTSVYVDTGVIGSIINYFYIVRSKFQDSANNLSADSNQTGKFGYGLTPGN